MVRFASFRLIMGVGRESMSALAEELALLFVNEQRWIIPETLIARPAFRAASYLGTWADGGPPPQEQEFAAFMRKGNSVGNVLLLTFAPVSMTGDRDPYNQVFGPLVAAGRVQRQKVRYLEYRLADVAAGHAVRARVTAGLMSSGPVPLPDALLAVIMYAAGLWRWCEMTEPPADGRWPVTVAPDPAAPSAAGPFVLDLSGGRNQPQPGPLQGRAYLLASGNDTPAGAAPGVLPALANVLFAQYSKEVAEHRPGGSAPH